MTWLERISGKIKRRIPQIDDFEDGELYLDDLIEDALHAIVDYAKADAYDTKWDRLLVTCAVMLFRYDGQEGSLSRSANGVEDTYPSTAILSELLSAEIVPYLRPSGHVYSSTRYNYPTE